MNRAKNIPASVHARLLNISKATNRHFNELLQYYGMERFLYRLSRSTHKDEFVLKGALMLQSLGSVLSRPTMDIDLLCKLSNQHELMARVIRECMATEVADGMTYDADSLTTEEIIQNAAFPGIRIKFIGHLGTARLNFQIDVGFGDAVTPGPIWINYPDLLDFGTPRILAYPPETAIAEKLQIMVDRDTANSRMKDFFDLEMMAKHLTFDGATLLEAVKATFKTRNCEIPMSPPLALTFQFGSSPEKATQWRAFLRKLRIDDVMSFDHAIEQLAAFLLPILNAAANGQSFDRTWHPSGPWA